MKSYNKLKNNTIVSTLSVLTFILFYTLCSQETLISKKNNVNVFFQPIVDDKLLIMNNNEIIYSKNSQGVFNLYKINSNDNELLNNTNNCFNPFIFKNKIYCIKDNNGDENYRIYSVDNEQLSNLQYGFVEKLFYEKKGEGEGKTTFKIPYHISPIDVSVFPLMKKEELLRLSEKIKQDLEKNFVVDYDISGSIGKRYLRSAGAGTPYAITIDYDSIKDKAVTLRDRDSEKQKRVKISELKEILNGLLSEEVDFKSLK